MGKVTQTKKTTDEIIIIDKKEYDRELGFLSIRNEKGKEKININTEDYIRALSDKLDIFCVQYEDRQNVICVIKDGIIKEISAPSEVIILLKNYVSRIIKNVFNVPCDTFFYVRERNYFDEETRRKIQERNKQIKESEVYKTLSEVEKKEALLDECEEYTMSISENMIMETINNNEAKIIRETVLAQAQERVISSTDLMDYSDTCFRYFQNGVMEISAKGKVFLTYDRFFDKHKKYIFKNQILSRAFHLPKKKELGAPAFEIAKFVQNITGVANEGAGTNEENRHEWARLLLGYLCHNYTSKDGAMERAVIVTDSRASDNPEGRTGKDLFLSLVRFQMDDIDKQESECAYTIIDGKQYTKSNQFLYDDCTQNTKIIHLQDVKRNHNIEDHFVQLSKGFKINKKNVKPFTIKSKLAISTNYSVKIAGASAKQRVYELSLVHHYSAEFTPEIEFGRRFFSYQTAHYPRGWTAQDWNEYDLFMAECVELYLRKRAENYGNIKVFEDALADEKKLNDLVPEEVLLWFGNYEIKDGEAYYFADLFSAFLTYCREHKLSTRIESVRRFASCVRAYKEFSAEWKSDTNHPKKGWLQEKRAGKGVMIYFYAKKKKEVEESIF